MKRIMLYETFDFEYNIITLIRSKLEFAKSTKKYKYKCIQHHLINFFCLKKYKYVPKKTRFLCQKKWQNVPQNM